MPPFPVRRAQNSMLQILKTVKGKKPANIKLPTHSLRWQYKLIQSWAILRVYASSAVYARESSPLLNNFNFVLQLLSASLQREAGDCLYVAHADLHKVLSKDPQLGGGGCNPGGRASVTHWKALTHVPKSAGFLLLLYTV